MSSEGQTRSPYYAELDAAQQAAEANGLGLWSKVRALPQALSGCGLDVA